jgi:hypothetical protein
MHQLSLLREKKGLFAQLNYQLVPFMIDQKGLFETIPQAGSGFWEDIAMLGASINDGEILIASSKLKNMDVDEIVEKIQGLVDTYGDELEGEVEDAELGKIEAELQNKEIMDELELITYEGIKKGEDEKRPSARASEGEEEEESDEIPRMTRIRAFLTGMRVAISNYDDPFEAYKSIFIYFGKETKFNALKKARDYPDFFEKLQQLYKEFLQGTPEASLRTYELGAMLAGFIYYHAQGDPDKMNFLQTVFTRLPKHGGLDPETAVEIVNRNTPQNIRQLNIRIISAEKIDWSEYLPEARIDYDVRNMTIEDLIGDRMTEKRRKAIGGILRENDIVRVADLLRTTKKEIKRIRGIGAQTINVLDAALMEQLDTLQIGVEVAQGIRWINARSIELLFKRPKRGPITLSELLQRKRSFRRQLPENLRGLYACKTAERQAEYGYGGTCTG